MEQPINSSKPTQHYYGDIVRVLFVIAAGVMLLSLPFFVFYLPVSIYVALCIILILEIIAGVTNPVQMWVGIADTVVAVGGVMVFGYYAIDSYLTYSVRNGFFWTNQFLAIIFLVALYFSVKTLRGFVLKGGGKHGLSEMWRGDAQENSFYEK